MSIEGPETGRVLLEAEELLEDEELWQDDGGADHAGWHCVATDPFPCPAAGCVFVAEFMTAAHLILVWQERDDPNLLRHAGRAKQVGRNPRVVSYEPLRPERLVLRLGGSGQACARRTRQLVIEHHFGRAAPWTLGVEEELLFVDAETFDLAPAFSTVVGESTEELKPELFECFAELATPVVSDTESALAELRRLRGELAERARPHGIVLHAAGSHAVAHGAGQPLVPIERYRRMAAELGERIYHQLVCGLHVHVSVPDPATCLRAFEGVVQWLPVLLGLSANSPFAEGEDTGRRSVRAERLLEMPTGGTPPLLRTWDDWTAATRGDNTRRHWDAWPRPEYGTLEVRVMDMQTDVRRSAGLVELVRAVVVIAAEAEADPEPYDRALYARRRAEAAAHGSATADVEALAAHVAAALNPGVRHWVKAVLDAPPEAERQLEVAAADGIAAVPRDVVERTVAFD